MTEPNLQTFRHDTAARTGVLAQNGEIPAQAAVQTAGKSRDEVKAELATAQRTGTVLNYYGA